MKKGMTRFFLLLCIALVASGCATKKTKQEINLLKTQVGGLTTEVNRLSEEQKFMQDTLKSSEERRAELESQVGGRVSRGGATTEAGVYRTPSGFEVKATELQTALKNAGYYDGSIDGKVGSGTIDAIKRFQTDNGLKADGICGRKTWQKLGTYAEGAAVK